MHHERDSNRRCARAFFSIRSDERGNARCHAAVELPGWRKQEIRDSCRRWIRSMCETSLRSTCRHSLTNGAQDSAERPHDSATEFERMRRAGQSTVEVTCLPSMWRCLRPCRTRRRSRSPLERTYLSTFLVLLSKERMLVWEICSAGRPSKNTRRTLRS